MKTTHCFQTDQKTAGIRAQESVAAGRHSRWAPLVAGAMIIAAPLMAAAPVLLSSHTAKADDMRYQCIAKRMTGEPSQNVSMERSGGKVKNFIWRVALLRGGHVEISFSDAYVNDLIDASKSMPDQSDRSKFIQSRLSRAIDIAIVRTSSATEARFECPITPTDSGGSAASAPATTSPPLPTSIAPGTASSPAATSSSKPPAPKPAVVAPGQDQKAAEMAAYKEAVSPGIPSEADMRELDNKIRSYHGAQSGQRSAAENDFNGYAAGLLTRIRKVRNNLNALSLNVPDAQKKKASTITTLDALENRVVAAQDKLINEKSRALALDGFEFEIAQLRSRHSALNSEIGSCKGPDLPTQSRLESEISSVESAAGEIRGRIEKSSLDTADKNALKAKLPGAGSIASTKENFRKKCKSSSPAPAPSTATPGHTAPGAVEEKDPLPVSRNGGNGTSANPCILRIPVPTGTTAGDVLRDFPFTYEMSPKLEFGKPITVYYMFRFVAQPRPQGQKPWKTTTRKLADVLAPLAQQCAGEVRQANNVSDLTHAYSPGTIFTLVFANLNSFQSRENDTDFGIKYYLFGPKK